MVGWGQDHRRYSSHLTQGGQETAHLVAAPGQRQRDPEGQVSQSPSPWLGPNSVLWKDHPHPVYSVAASEKGSAGFSATCPHGCGLRGQAAGPFVGSTVPSKTEGGPLSGISGGLRPSLCSNGAFKKIHFIAFNHNVCLCLGLPKLNLWSSSDPELVGPRDTAPDLASGRSFVYRSREAVMGHCCLGHGQVESLPFAASRSGLVQSHRPLVFHPPAFRGQMVILHTPVPQPCCRLKEPLAHTMGFICLSAPKSPRPGSGGFWPPGPGRSEGTEHSAPVQCESPPFRSAESVSVAPHLTTKPSLAVSCVQ